MSRFKQGNNFFSMALARLLSRSSRHVLRSCVTGCGETVESAATSAGRFDPSSSRGGGSYRYSRFSTLVSWGVNGSGECGVSQRGAWDTHAFTSLVSSPTEVLEDGLGFTSISAGLAHGAAVVSDGTVFTFGKGSNGELGTGRMDPVLEASRVEHLVGHHRIQSVAAGRTCTWFLNEEGNVLGCGTYATGAAYGMDEHWGSGSSGSSGSLGAMGSLDEDDMLDEVGGLQIFAGGRQGTHQQGIGMMDAYGNFMRDNVKSSSTPAQRPGHSLQHFIPFIDHQARSIEVQQSKYLFSDPLRSMAEIDSAQRVWGDIAELSCFSENVSLPTLTGGAGLVGRVVASSQNMLNRNSISSLGTCLYSGRTLAINSEGLPVVVEALRPSRALPMDPMSMPASWAQSSMPPPVVISVVEDNGGAVKAVVGEDWYAVLCRDGRVVVWWSEDWDGARAGPGGSSRRPKSPSPAESSPGKRMKVKTIKKGSSVFCTQDGTAVTTISVGGDDRIQEVSASLGELFVSDGRRVWRLAMPSKNRMDAIARIKMDENATEDAAALVMDVGEAQVRTMEANARGTLATVTDSGHLWILGDVVSESDLSYVIGKQDQNRGRIWEGIRSVNGSEAVLVPGLHGVSDVSLGEHHALAVVA